MKLIQGEQNHPSKKRLLKKNKLGTPKENIAVHY